MAWKVEFDELDPEQARRILKYLYGRIATKENPRRFGEPLRDNLSGLWRYRIGAYRLICDIQDDRVLVLVLRIGHRSTIYGGH